MWQKILMVAVIDAIGKALLTIVQLLQDNKPPPKPRLPPQPNFPLDPYNPN